MDFILLFAMITYLDLIRPLLKLDRNSLALILIYIQCVLAQQDVPKDILDAVNAIAYDHIPEGVILNPILPKAPVSSDSDEALTEVVEIIEGVGRGGIS